MKNNNKYFSVYIVLLLSILAIIFGKVVRYTIMEETLVIPGVGWGMVDNINEDNYDFGITIKDNETDEADSTSGANAGFIISKIDFLNLADTYYEYEIIISILWNFFVLLIIFNLKKYYSLLEMLFILASISVLNVFDFCLAKEPIQMLYFILMYLILISKKSQIFKFVGSILVFLLSALTYRNYYILMAGFMIYIYILYKVITHNEKPVKLRKTLFIFLAIYFCYFFVLNVAKFVVSDAFNELIRVRLRTSTAASDMRALFMSENLVLFTFDYVIMIFRMLIPIELLRLGPKYFIYVLYQVMISFIMFKTLKNVKNISSDRRIALFVYFAFLLGSATFEPDFGSWIRHEAVLFPIFMLMAGFKEKENKIE